jgi:hypothetical protein
MLEIFVVYSENVCSQQYFCDCNRVSRDKQLFPIYLTKSKEARHHVNLLYLCNRNNQHWCLIKKHLNRFLCHTRARGHSYYFCRYCLQGFRSDATLSNHLQYCSRHGAQSTTFPSDLSLLQFHL